MSLALAFKIEEVEGDPSLVASARKECPACDPDNPRAVLREVCGECGGSGLVGLAVLEIAKELKASKAEKGSDLGQVDDPDGLYLEY